jgi:hypothetical protein
VAIPKGYWKRLGDATSQWWNVAIFDGMPNESISGRSWREDWPRMRAFVDFLLWFDRDGERGHCELSDLRDIERCRQRLEELGFTVIEPPQ